MTRRLRTARGRRLSVATRLALAVVLVSTVTIGVTSIVGLDAGERLTDRLLQARLTSSRTGAAIDAAAYVNAGRRGLTGLADSPMTVDALERFTTAFAGVEPPERGQLATERVALLSYYADEVIPALDAAHGSAVTARSLVPETATGVHLQYLFLPQSPGDDPADLDEPAGDSEWAGVHADLHPVFRDAATRLGAEDLLLVAANGDVVYSVAKSADFATNLVVGEHGSRILGATFRTMRAAATGGASPAAATTDLSSYPPALGRPVWFQVAPVLVDGRFAGAIATRRGVGPLTALLDVGSGAGPDARQDEGSDDGIDGDTLESYLAGVDGLLRSDPRIFAASPEQYLLDAVAAGTLTEDAADLARARESTVLLQRADGDVVASGRTAPTSVETRVDHLGRDARMVAAPLGDIGGPEWVVVTQITDAEASAPLEDYRRLLLTVAAVLTAIITFGAVAWANRLVRPVRAIGERLRLRHDDRELVAGAPPIETGCEEFGRLAAGFEAMDHELTRRRLAAEAAHEEWLETLGALLPPAIASRVDAGDRSVLNRIDAVSVVVVVLREIDDGTGNDGAGNDGIGPEPDVHTRIDPLLAGLDQLAAAHEVGRVKFVGDTWFGAVGHQQPVLDHARRAAEFARNLLAALPTLTDRHAAVAIGIASGPVNVGLGGSARLVYDIWGPTVGEAYALARQASTGSALLADDTFDRLPDGAGTVPVELSGGRAWRLLPERDTIRDTSSDTSRETTEVTP